MSARRPSMPMVLMILVSGIAAADDLPSVGSLRPAAPLRHSLPQLVALAEESSPNLREAALAVEAARGHAQQAGLYPNPMIEAGSDQLAGRDSQYFSRLSQEIVTAGKLRLDRAAASQDVRKAEQDYVRIRFQLLTAVRQQFGTVLAAQRRVAALRQLVEIARKSKETAAQLEKAGEGTRVDTILLDVELQRAEVAHENALALLDAARRQLAAALGQPELALGTLEGDLNAEFPDYRFEALRSGVVTENALARGAEIEIERARILLRRAQVEPIPNVTVSAGYMYSVTPLNNMTIVMASVPLPAWNRNQGNIRAAMANVGKSAEALSRTQNELAQQVAETLGRYQAARQLTERFEKEILPKARQSQALTQQGYRGQFDFLRLLQAQRTLVEADLSAIDAYERRWLAAADLAGLLQSETFP